MVSYGTRQAGAHSSSESSIACSEMGMMLATQGSAPLLLGQGVLCGSNRLLSLAVPIWEGLHCILLSTGLDYF